MTAQAWKRHLENRLDDELAREIDIFEQEIELRRSGKLSDKVFAETRLRRGVYGQRYDNGQRHDGSQTRKIDFPCGELTKGPGTVWDAPGMMRIKIPCGRLNPEQMDLLADIAEEYSDAICHVTTRQDVQLHFVHLEDTPTLMRRLASVGITTREACGNAVRNTTACQFAGVCSTEPFDVTPYAEALTHYLLGHDDTQDFGRKFKIAFSGCREEACGLVTIHDLGFIATTRDGKRGFEAWIGGGLGGSRLGGEAESACSAGERSGPSKRWIFPGSNQWGISASPATTTARSPLASTFTPSQLLSCECTFFQKDNFLTYFCCCCLRYKRFGGRLLEAL